MKKSVLIITLAIFLVLPLISALNLKIEQKTDDVAMIVGLGMPAMFDLTITNLGTSDNLMFYNFFGSDTLPKGTVSIGNWETKDVSVGVYPRDDLKQEGRIVFDIYVKGEDGSQVISPLMVNVVQLKDAFIVGADEFDPESNTVSVYMKNAVNFNFNKIKATFKSPFFNFEKEFSLAPYEKKSFDVVVNKEDFKDLMAGFYTLDVDTEVGTKQTKIEGTMKFSEKDIVTTSQDDYGVIISTKKITKTNEGNVISKSSTVLKKSIISRLFTTFSPEPDLVERKGLSVYYTWERELNPGDSLEIVVKTNWLLPLLAILLIISVVILVKQFSRTSLSLKKKVTFVRAKGGEFALKVSVIVNARHYIQRVNVIDRLPMLVKLHERFGGEMPKKVDEKNRRIEWYFEKLQAGESRVISYIIYSKVGVLGKFALPTTTAVYEKDGQVHEAESNHAFFIAEQIRKPIED